jgi:predicted MFS family arabinose efflux permease
VKLEGRSLIIAMCIGQVGNLLPHVVVPAIMVQHLIPLWDLSSGEAGLMAGAYAIGYMIAVPFLTTLTDRIDARTVLIFGSVMSGIATIAFGLFADGPLSAALIWGLAGISFAGAYMPGLKALTDRLPPGENSRAVTLYTSSFSIGVGLSFLVSQLAADAFGWRVAFIVTGLGPLMVLVCVGLMRAVPNINTQARLLDFSPVANNRAALGYIIGYGAHCFELYGVRTWIVAFWTYVVAQNVQTSTLSPLIVSFIFSVIAMPASVVGNELALRFGRHRAITIIMLASAVIALAIGIFADASPLILLPLMLVYALTVPADSGALTSGMAAAAFAGSKGATMAVHTTVGFAFAAIGSWGVGEALDLGGGPQSSHGWLAAFAVLAIGISLGPFALYWSRMVSNR